MKKRWINYIIAFFIIITLNFVIPRLLPGDPLSAIYGDEVLLNLSDEATDYINKLYGLDKPVIAQYFIYVFSIFRGNFGYSIYHKKPVLEILISHLPYTLILTGLSMLLASISGAILGIESGWRRGKKIDRFILSSIIFISGFPAFFTGAIFLIIFGIILGILPFQGAVEAYSGFSGFNLAVDFLKHLVLPLFSLVIVYIPTAYLLTRNSMISSLKEPYILFARAKGLTDTRIRYMHAGRNSLIPLTTQMGIHLATGLITGALFIEIVYSYPGMGTLIYNSILNRDYPVLQGSLFMVTLLVLIVNFFMDIFYVKLDPRIEYAH